MGENYSVVRKLQLHHFSGLQCAHVNSVISGNSIEE